MTRILLFVSLTIFITGLLALLSCENDITPPDPVEPEEHLFYIAESSGGKVKVFSVEERKITDSVIFNDINSDDVIIQLHVFGDDKRLLASSKDKTYIKDLKNGQTDGSLNGYRRMYVSPNSEYFLAINKAVNRWEIHRMDDLQLLHFDTVNALLPQFSIDSKSLAYQEHEYNITLYDFEKDSIINIYRYLNNDSVQYLWPFPIYSKSKIFFGGATWGYGCFAGVTDFNSDSVRILTGIPFGSTIVSAVSPDDKYIYSIITPTIEGSPNIILVFDVASEEFVKEISTNDLQQPGYMSITVDGKYILTRYFHYFYSDTTKVGLIDAEKFEVLGLYDFGSGAGYAIATKREQIRR